MGDGGLIEPQFFILFSELGVDPIWLLSNTDICPWSSAHRIPSFEWSKKPTKQGNKNKDQEFEPFKMLPAFILYQINGNKFRSPIFRSFPGSHSSLLPYLRWPFLVTSTRYD